jgi:ABC-type transport system substrate-binding protein
MMFDITRTAIYEYNLPENPLIDQRVRQAIAHALDIESFISNQLLGRANLLVIPAMRHLIGYPGMLEPYRFDPYHSKQLLDEANFPDGFVLNIRTHKGQFTEIISEFVKNSLSDIDIDVNIDMLEFEGFQTSFSRSVPQSMITNLTVTLLSDSILGSLYSLFTVDSPMNPMRNRNTRILELIENISYINEYDTQLPLFYRELANLIYDEVIIIPFFQPFNLYVYGKNIRLYDANHFLYSNIKVGR